MEKNPLGTEDWIRLVKADPRFSKLEWVVDRAYHGNVERAVLEFFNQRQGGGGRASPSTSLMSSKDFSMISKKRASAWRPKKNK